jgi:metal-sulfur cluster biosynthetic enzyme
MVYQGEVIKKLKQCLDPELGINIVDLGLIYNVSIEGSRIDIMMILTTPNCPLDSYLVKDVTSKLKAIKGVLDVSIEFTFEPPWNLSRISEESRKSLGFVN